MGSSRDPRKNILTLIAVLAPKKCSHISLQIFTTSEPYPTTNLKKPRISNGQEAHTSVLKVQKATFAIFSHCYYLIFNL